MQIIQKKMTWIGHNANNTKVNDMDWAHVPAMRAFFLMQWNDSSHRFDACCPAVRRSRF